MKIIIKTFVWQGEFDESEFPHFVRTEPAEMPGYMYVIEEIELGEYSSVTIRP